jgi:hypothetical protein
MSTVRKTVIALGGVLIFAGAAYGGSDWLKGNTEQQLKTLAALQPGLGTIMIEYSHRFGTMYYAAKGGNWGMAGYQLKEAREIQEVGEATRPQFASGLKNFEKLHLEPLASAIKDKDWKKFEHEVKRAEEGCNSCHAAQGYPFIKYELPRTSPSPTSNRP